MTIKGRVRYIWVTTTSERAPPQDSPKNSLIRFDLLPVTEPILPRVPQLLNLRNDEVRNVMELD